MTILRILLSIAVLSGALPIHVQATDSACDFSRYKPLVVDHARVNADEAVKKVEPKYPATGTRVRAQGEVRVKILVNRKGNVVAACATEGHPLLRASALNAARQWKFLPNFGFETKQRRKYIEAFLVFNFVLK